MRNFVLAALAAVGLSLGGWSAAPAQYVQYYTPYTYGSTAYYTYPNTGYMSYYPYSGYTNSYYGPTVYGPGYVASYPYMYNQYNYGYTSPYNTYSYPYTTYRTWRWGR
jgi:hypothetical protein